MHTLVLVLTHMYGREISTERILQVDLSPEFDYNLYLSLWMRNHLRMALNGCVTLLDRCHGRQTRVLSTVFGLSA